MKFPIRFTVGLGRAGSAFLGMVLVRKYRGVSANAIFGPWMLSAEVSW